MLITSGPDTMLARSARSRRDSNGGSDSDDYLQDLPTVAPTSVQPAPTPSAPPRLPPIEARLAQMDAKLDQILDGLVHLRAQMSTLAVAAPEGSKMRVQSRRQH
uniref:Uncharacterized protein n=1 Tax=Zhangye Chuvi tick virus 1 TaxID=2972091 RepID=A0A9E7V236_9VIRU|nr:MAG: hypothetical protein [Zhangye Chuvi tick virus 1]